jgi:hypothetical protein
MYQFAAPIERRRQPSTGAAVELGRAERDKSSWQRINLLAACLARQVALGPLDAAAGRLATRTPADRAPLARPLYALAFHDKLMTETGERAANCLASRLGRHEWRPSARSATIASSGAKWPGPGRHGTEQMGPPIRSFVH